MQEYKWFKILIIILSLCFLFILCKNYFIINKTEKINFELIEITKRWSRHSYISEAVLKIDNKVYTFEVHAQFYDIYKKTGEVKFNVYYDNVFNKYITTADYYFARNLIYLLILLNLIVFSNFGKKIYKLIESFITLLIDKLNKIFP
jgi:hypothetical protein